MRIGNRGQVLLIFLAGLLALLGITALGVDVGYMYTARHELQRCTDAGALAGASAFIQGSWSDPGVRNLADSRARTFAAKDKVATSTLAPASEVSVAFPAAERVRVQASRTVPLFFSRLFLGPTKTITATSVAEASAAGSNVKGLKPWGIPFPWEDTNGNDEYDAGETVNRECPIETSAQGSLSPRIGWIPATGGGARPVFAPGPDDGVAGRRVDGSVGDRLPPPSPTFRAADVGFLRGDAGGPQDRDAAEQPEKSERHPLPAAGVRPLLRPRPRRYRGLRLPGHDRGRQQ